MNAEQLEDQVRSDFVQRNANRPGGSVGSAEIRKWLTHGLWKFAAKVAPSATPKLVRRHEVHVGPGLDRFAIPGDFVLPVHFAINYPAQVDGYYRPATLLGPDERYIPFVQDVESALATQAVERPHWWMEGDWGYVYPKNPHATDAAKGLLIYKRVAKPLDNPGDVPEISEAHHPILGDYATSKAYARDGNVELANLYRQYFEDHVAAVSAEAMGTAKLDPRGHP